MSKQLQRIREDLDYLIDAWPDLVLSLEPGTRRRWSQRRPDPDKAAEMAEQIRQERADLAKASLGLMPAGWSPAPVDVSVLDTLRAIAYLADDLAATVGECAGEPMDPRRSAHLDPRPFLLHARAYLTAAHEQDSRTGRWVAEQLRPVVAAVHAHRGELTDGQVLDAICPWCGGRTEANPIGGERTLSLREPDVDDESVEVLIVEPLIVCHGLSCTPPLTACSRQVGGHPAWPRREWEWLAGQLRAIEPAAAAGR